MSKQTSGGTKSYCPECGAELLKRGECWLCNWQLSSEVVTAPVQPSSTHRTSLSVLTFISIGMALLIGITLVVQAAPLGLTYFVIVLPALASLFAMIKREPGPRSVGQAALDVLMSLSIVLGAGALLIGGGIVALLLICYMEGGGSFQVR